ncbi:hypothetical protein C8R47DRAFT_1144439 [Mycena vitilis]|nr:hypothetical protein C8R47DRAFT_1144439 [Mycena vitilis]
MYIRLLSLTVIATSVLASPLRRGDDTGYDFCPAMNLDRVSIHPGGFSTIGAPYNLGECTYGKDACEYHFENGTLSSISPDGCPLLVNLGNAKERNGCPIVNLLNAPVLDSSVSGGLLECLYANVTDIVECHYSTNVSSPTALSVGEAGCPLCLPASTNCTESQPVNSATSTILSTFTASASA